MEYINILSATDNNYAPFHGVMLTSLFMNNKDSRFVVYMLADETWDDEETKRFEELCNQHNSTFHLIKVDNRGIKDFPKRAHITLPTYYRLLACNLLPKAVHKVLLLDGDIIVRGDIRPLWNINLEGYAFAAAEDMDSVTGDCYTRLRYDAKYGYCNAGVSLYNFDFWRDNQVSERMIRLIKETPNTLKWMDQDALNMLLHEKRYNIPLRYNFQVPHLSKQYWDLYSKKYKKTIEEECENAVIIHFNSHNKPWTFRYLGFPFNMTWRFYNKKSLWKIDVNKPRIKYYKQCIKRLLFPALAFKERNCSIIQDYWNYK